MRKKEQMSDDSIDEDRCHWLIVSLFDDDDDDDDDDIPCWILFSSHISFRDIDQLSNKSERKRDDLKRETDQIEISIKNTEQEISNLKEEMKRLSR